MLNPLRFMGALLFVTTIFKHGIAPPPAVPEWAKEYVDIYCNHLTTRIGPFQVEWRGTPEDGFLCPEYEISPQAEHEWYSIKIQDHTKGSSFTNYKLVKKSDGVGKWTKLEEVNLHTDTKYVDDSTIAISLKIEPSSGPAPGQSSGTGAAQSSGAA